MIMGPKGKHQEFWQHESINDQGYGYKYREIHYLKFKKEVTNETKILTKKKKKQTPSNIRKRGEDRAEEETMS